MKEVRIVLDDQEHMSLLKIKGDRSWKKLLLSTIKEEVQIPTDEKK